MLLYLVPLVFSLLGATGRFYRASFVVAAIYLALCVYWSPNRRNSTQPCRQPRMKMMGDDVERARKMVRLLIAAL